jgi:hypothetical protein
MTEGPMPPRQQNDLFLLVAGDEFQAIAAICLEHIYCFSVQHYHPGWDATVLVVSVEYREKVYRWLSRSRGIPTPLPAGYVIGVAEEVKDEWLPKKVLAIE